MFSNEITEASEIIIITDFEQDLPHLTQSSQTEHTEFGIMKDLNTKDLCSNLVFVFPELAM